MINFNFLKPFGKLFTNLMRGFKIGKLKLPTMGLEKNLKGIAKLQLKLGEAIGKAVTNVSNAYKSLTTGLSTRFSSISKSISKAGGGMKGLAKLGITKVMAGFSKVLQMIMKGLSMFGIVFTQIGKIFIPLNKTMGASGPMKGIVTSISKFAPMFKGVLSTLKFVASKVLLPLFALFDLITGFIEGFKLKGDDDTRGTLERVFDGVVAGIIKAFKGIVIIPLDLIRKGAAWLAEKMGIDWLADALGSFSFEDAFDFIIKFVTNWFSTKPEEGYFSIVKFALDILDGVVEGFQVLKNEGPAEFVKWLGEKVKGIIDMIKDFLAGMLEKATFGLFGGEDDPEAEKAELEKKIAEEQAKIDRSKAGANEYLGFEGAGQKASENRIKMMERELEHLQSKNQLIEQENQLMLEQNNVNEKSLELNKRTEDVAAQKDENINGGRGGVIADVGNVTDASTNVNNVSHNYSPGPPSARADMSDNPMMAWKTA